MKRPGENIIPVGSRSQVPIVLIGILIVTAMCIILLTLDFLPVLRRAERKAAASRLVKPGDTREQVCAALGRAGFLLIMDTSTSDVGVLLDHRQAHTADLLMRAGLQQYLPKGLAQQMIELRFDSKGVLTQGIK